MSDAGRYTGGCDVGSTTGKAVIFDAEASVVVGSAIVASRIDPEQTARAALQQALAQVPALAERGVAGLACLVGTGYGRNEVPFANENISEITCHGVGAHFCDPSIRTLVDIGGQDVKAIALNPDGTVREFAMNDKCAAGTGRFFEAMARTFQLTLEEFSDLSLQAKRVIPVSSQCSVFAESEVISLLAKKQPAPDVAAGIQAAVGKRVFALARRVGVEPALTITGGCAKNAGLRAQLAKVLRHRMTPLSVDPQLVGALGAAVLAHRRAG